LVSLYVTSLADPVSALVWLEKSRSRTLIESLGLSELSVAYPPPDAEAALRQERELLQKANTIRESIFFERAADTDVLAEQQKLYATTKELDQLWTSLERHLPEYVGIRRGQIVTWPQITALLAS
jgi:hypothetical protein